MNRKRVLWPLLLAAAFALGVLAARVQAGAIFLPLVVRAWDGEPVATPAPSAMIRAESVHYHALRQCFYGELVNETACTVSMAEVTLYLLDADGLPIGDQTGYLMAPILSPGERTPFQVYWLGIIPTWDSYVVTVQWDPIDRLTIEGTQLVEGESGGCQVIATVCNQLPVRVQALAVGMVLYAPTGEVIGYDDPWGVLGPLAPGDRVVVSHTFDKWDWDASIEPVGCAAFAVPSGGLGLSVTEQGHDQDGER